MMTTSSKMATATVVATTASGNIIERTPKTSTDETEGTVPAFGPDVKRR
jgi:hypothetical protein